MGGRNVSFHFSSPRPIAQMKSQCARSTGQMERRPMRKICRPWSLPSLCDLSTSNATKCGNFSTKSKSTLERASKQDENARTRSPLPEKVNSSPPPLRVVHARLRIVVFPLDVELCGVSRRCCCHTCDSGNAGGLEVGERRDASGGAKEPTLHDE